LRGRLAKLGGNPQGVLGTLSLKVPDPDDWNFANPSASDFGALAPADLVEPISLPELLHTLAASAYEVSDAISTTYFTHSGQTKHSVGT
jgi:hypothetical protein